MFLLKPSFKIEGFYMDNPCDMERIGRVCYKSEDRITEGSAEKFIKARLGAHESVIEHSALTVRFICDRGVTHELVRHRLCSFSQESTRYCNYFGRLTFIIPPWIDIPEGDLYRFEDGKQWYGTNKPVYEWYMSLVYASMAYEELLNLGWSPQQARSVLPNSLKTEIIMTANFREWRHVFRLRCDKAAHPQMQELMRPLLTKVKTHIPIIFDDITF